VSHAAPNQAHVFVFNVSRLLSSVSDVRCEFNLSIAENERESPNAHPASSGANGLGGLYFAVFPSSGMLTDTDNAILQ
jgi:hypothetical protein